ncbi:putative ABC-type phosphate transporter [Helianthus anomalus]
MAYYTPHAIPAALTYYWRMKMPETTCFTALVSHFLQDIAQVLQVEIKVEEHKVAKIAYATRNSFGLFSKDFARRHGLQLHGFTSTWFLLDIAFY